MAKFIKTQVKDGIGIIALDRPETMNAWHQPMRIEIADALKAYNADPKVRAVILTGTGDRAWSAGQDLAETMQIKGAEEGEAWAKQWIDFYNALRHMDKAVVAALNGVAAGSAYQYAMLCDVRVGHSGSRMGQPEINSGITSVTGPWIMYDRIGRSRAIELTLRGRMMGGDEAHEIGLIHYLVPQKDVMAKAMEVAKVLAGKAPLAMKLTKQRFREMTEEGFWDSMNANRRINAENYASGEPQEAMREFFEERARRKAEAGKATKKAAPSGAQVWTVDRAKRNAATAKPAKKAAAKKAGPKKATAKKTPASKKKAAPKKKTAAKKSAARKPARRMAPKRKAPNRKAPVRKMGRGKTKRRR
jgi:enoyl-CoA hydratase/carnithine racemase